MLASALVLSALATGPAEPAASDLTVGAIARDIASANDPAVVPRWRAALKDPRAELRAAAARAIIVTRARALLPDIEAALQSESLDGARGELLRAAVVLRPADRDSELVAAVRDPQEATHLARALLRVRGAGAAAHLPALLQAGFEPGIAYLVALQLEAGTRERLARHALETRDASLWQTVISVEGDASPALTDEVLAEGLRIPDVGVRAATFRFLAVRGAKGALSPLLEKAVSEQPAQPDASPQEVLSRELLSRAGGAPPRAIPGWVASLATDTFVTPPPELYADEAGRKLFTQDEWRALSQAITGDPGGLDRDKKTPAKKTPDVAAGTSSKLSMWLLSGLPPGYRAGIFEATGCRPGADLAGGAEVRFAPDGRPRAVSLLPDRLKPECREAVTLLAGSSLFPSDTEPVPAEPVVLLAVLDNELFACQDEQPAKAAARRDRSKGMRPGVLEAPRKVRNVPPSYPEAARQSRIQGPVVLEAVISASGCVTDLKLLDTDHPSLVVAAMRAVVKWRYKPARINGVAVPVVMTVTVNFRLS